MQRLPRVLIPLALAASALTFPAGGVITARALGATPGNHSGRPAHHGGTPPPEVTLTPPGGPAVQVTMPPVGLSMEYPVMAEDLGTGSCPPPALVTELQQLGSPPLALAGLSQDETAPSGALSGTPVSWETASLYPLPATFWSQLHCLLGGAPDPLTVGLNAKTGSPSWATQMVAGAQSAATDGLNFSLGNEPDLYYLPNYSALYRPQNVEEAVAASRYAMVAAYLQPAIGGAPVVGPELAAAVHWQHELPRVIEQLHERTVGVHLYPLTACGGPRAVTLRGLLSAHAGDAPHSLAWVVADADAAQVPAIISEANSASCGGVAGVSDSPAAAVWAVRFVLSALKTGFREVRFHFSGGPYDPFIVRGQEVIARPLQSGLVALNEWLPVGSSLYTVHRLPGLLATGVRESTGQTLLIFDNEGVRARPVVLRATHSVRIAVLTAARAGLQTEELSPTHRRIRLAVAPSSVLAVLAAP
jgi:hypothetical protein